MQYALPILLFVGLGLLAGLLLSIFSGIFAVEQDQRAVAVREALPGANCGACGYSGCDAYAEAVANGEAKTNCCIPGGDKVSRDISEILGVPFEDVVEQTATVRCNGCIGATIDKYDYTGEASCAASNMYYNGKKLCTAGCLGLGDCVKVCQYGALSIKDGIAVVDRDLCTGCKMCVSACPNGLIEVFDSTKRVEVICSSHFNAKQTMTMCKNGCIACKKCERTCQYDAIHVIDNHAIIDHEKCTQCGECIEACPRKCIHLLDPARTA
jgi:electron transport complex protein RnfB